MNNAFHPGSMMSSIPDDLMESFLAIDVVKEDKAYVKRRRLRVGQRYFSGLLKVLLDMPKLDHLVVDFSSAQLITSIRTLTDPALYGRASSARRGVVLEGVTQDQIETAKQFYKQMQSTRGALGTSSETTSALRGIVPPSFDKEGAGIPLVISRNQALWLCGQVLEDPEFKLNEQGMCAMLAAELDSKTAVSVIPRQSSPRL